MEPAVKPAAALTKTGVIGVLATQGTFKGQLYLTTSEKYARRKQVKIIERVGEGLVELVESGNTDSPEAEALVKKYIDPMVEEGADCVVLGCTHYPFLEKVIRRVASDSLQIINPAPAVARRARNLLEKARKSRVYASSSERQLKKEHRITVATTGSHTDVLRKLTAGVVEEIKYQGLLNESQIDSLGQIFFVSLEI